MKVSGSPPQEDFAAPGVYATDAPRSAAIHAPTEALRAGDLDAEYSKAFAEWDASDDAAFWDRASGDGITDEVW